MSESTDQRPPMRIPDEQLAAPLAHGASIRHSPLMFTMDFLVPDESGASDYMVVRRVHIDPTAMPGIINAINLQWNEWEMERAAQP